MGEKDKARAWRWIRQSEDGIMDDLVSQKELKTIKAEDLAWRVLDQITGKLEAADR